ncbi:MAG: hypothetical protein GY787_23110 [Alteromonadales bacterium]|nr:hypothetical protein [Alteromonadales bacterium]
MALTLSQIKALFETGDTPTEAQYITVWDSMRLQDVEIPQTDVEKLAPLSVVVATSGNIVVPSDSVILYIVLIPASSGSYTIGTTPGGVDIESGSLTGTTSYTLGMAGEHNTASKTIYFTSTTSFEARIIIR